LALRVYPRENHRDESPRLVFSNPRSEPARSDYRPIHGSRLKASYRFGVDMKRLMSPAAINPRSPTPVASGDQPDDRA
jgi:hypothetical protein